MRSSADMGLVVREKKIMDRDFLSIKGALSSAQIGMSLLKDELIWRRRKFKKLSTHFNYMYFAIINPA